ncbi:hypothetical protein GPECTOR_24g189 [Gonium pectorale]|uniref:Tc1-like transposase DDE domain-containing protein n=1 Tax=Gonium pectorale TaxID=33097 RepID=A0A150GHS2_GONPE|nr:hypothetical protein GPECTOR_24g189 [Gonium pectorale]|eukprot:KXZ48900.1 hypothetical protein GPECTOR_24g189 [Gonium pectorale]
MLRRILPGIRKIVGRNQRVFPHGMADVKLAMDRAPWHQAALKCGLLEGMGLGADQLVPHPPCSPDFQAPVEWSHQWLNNATREFLEHHPKIEGSRAIKEAMVKLFTGAEVVGRGAAVTQKKVAGAFKTLRRNYEAIVEAEGDWGEKRAT